MENISKPLKMTQTQTLVFYSEEMITSQAQKWQTTGIFGQLISKLKSSRKENHFQNYILSIKKM